MPVLCPGRSPQQEVDFLVRRLMNLPAGDSVLVAAPTREAVRQLERALSARGILVADGVPQCVAVPGDRRVALSVMKSSKGLQADHVCLCSLNEQLLLPHDAANDPEELSRTRRLLYVGMTRAVKTLSLSTSGTASRFLAEIAPDTVRKEASAS
jgi:superfamily I DNA/RNA helicase